MDYKQVHLETRTSFEFRSDGLVYVIKDGTGQRSNFISYDQIFLNQSYPLELTSIAVRNVGFFWFVFGVFMFAIDLQVNLLSFFMFPGLICIGIYYLAPKKYTVVPAIPANVLVLVDKKHDAIIKEIQERIRKSVLDSAGSINYDASYESEKAKYNSLLKNEIITEPQFNEYCETMEKNKDKFKIT